MHIWSPVNGEIEIICGPLLPCNFTATLGFQNPGSGPERQIPGEQAEVDGPVRFRVSAADVQTIKTFPARLMLRTEHVLIPGSANPQWGYRYTIVHPPGQMTVAEQGAPVPLDAQGYFNTPRSNYPDPPIVMTSKVIDLQ